MLKEKYNIDFKMVSNTDERAVLKKSVGAGDDIYDAVVIKNDLVPDIVTGNLLVNIDSLPYVDLTQPWWDPAVNSMSIYNKNYLLAGDMLILDNAATNGLLFNKELMADLGLDLPYNTVKEGKWTMDALNELIKGAAAEEWNRISESCLFPNMTKTRRIITALSILSRACFSEFRRARTI